MDWPPRVRCFAGSWHTPRLASQGHFDGPNRRSTVLQQLCCAGAHFLSFNPYLSVLTVRRTEGVHNRVWSTVDAADHQHFLQDCAKSARLHSTDHRTSDKKEKVERAYLLKSRLILSKHSDDDDDKKKFLRNLTSSLFTSTIWLNTASLGAPAKKEKRWRIVTRRFCWLLRHQNGRCSLHIRIIMKGARKINSLMNRNFAPHNHSSSVQPQKRRVVKICINHRRSDNAAQWPSAHYAIQPPPLVLNPWRFSSLFARARVISIRKRSFLLKEEEKNGGKRTQFN